LIKFYSIGVLGLGGLGFGGHHNPNPLNPKPLLNKILSNLKLKIKSKIWKIYFNAKISEN
jgi:hypothetical protein